MKLYDLGAFLLVVLVFGYLVVKVDQNTDGAKKPIDAGMLKAEIVEDYDEVGDFLAKGASANHGLYNQ